MSRDDTPMDTGLERAVSGRLAKLRSVPVDTSHLQRALRRQLPPPTAWYRRWTRPIAAVAASLLLLVSLALVLLPGREVQASPAQMAQMAQMHTDIVSGKIPMMKAESIDDANQAIAAMSGSFPKLPRPPMAHSMACCMKSVGHKKVACVLLEQEGVPVTMAVAPASDMAVPQGPLVQRHGAYYYVQQIGALHMVMTERQDKWVCLISEVPAERLMDLADQLKF